MPDFSKVTCIKQKVLINFLYERPASQKQMFQKSLNIWVNLQRGSSNWGRTCNRRKRSWKQELGNQAHH